MTIWIVEDEHLAAKQAAEVTCEVFGNTNTSIDIYWDQAILWESLLSAPPPAEYEPKNLKRDCPPTIVILDLLDGADEFRAESYLRQLRKSEADWGLPRSWVILWSVYTGRDQAQEFISKAPERDRRVVFSGSKQPELLRSDLEHCRRAWAEAQYP